MYKLAAALPASPDFQAEQIYVQIIVKNTLLIVDSQINNRDGSTAENIYTCVTFLKQVKSVLDK